MSTYEIRDYVARARREPTTEHIEELWRAVFLLQAWYFLPSRDEGPAFPVASEIDGAPWLLAFTNFRRLKDFARSIDRINPDGSAPMLVLDPAESTSKILSVRDSIEGVIFNIDSESTFRAPVQALESYAEHFEIPIDEQDWG